MRKGKKRELGKKELRSVERKANTIEDVVYSFERPFHLEGRLRKNSPGDLYLKQRETWVHVAVE